VLTCSPLCEVITVRITATIVTTPTTDHGNSLALRPRPRPNAVRRLWV
jgi:hypothetical protein